MREKPNPDEVGNGRNGHGRREARVLAFAGREGQGGVDYWEGDKSTPLFFPSFNRAPPGDIDMWVEA
jgi:hypothetical protein